jgi:hypothetical protein
VLYDSEIPTPPAQKSSSSPARPLAQDFAERGVVTGRPAWGKRPRSPCEQRVGTKAATASTVQPKRAYKHCGATLLLRPRASQRRSPVGCPGHWLSGAAGHADVSRRSAQCACSPDWAEVPGPALARHALQQLAHKADGLGQARSLNMFLWHAALPIDYVAAAFSFVAAASSGIMLSCAFQWRAAILHLKPDDEASGCRCCKRRRRCAWHWSTTAPRISSLPVPRLLQPTLAPGPRIDRASHAQLCAWAGWQPAVVMARPGEQPQ